MGNQGDNYRYRCLDAWRGIAALSVVIFHSGYYAVYRQSDMSSFEYIFSRIIKHLDIGVLLFFVISGYCISASTEVFRKSKNFPALLFFLQRFRRIYPAYWMAIIFALVVRSFGINPHLGLENESVNPVNFSLSQWLGNIALIETWRPLFTKSSEELFLPTSWSLCYEIQFYLLLGLMMVCRVRLLYWTIAMSGVTLIIMSFPRLIGLPSAYRLFLDGHWLFFGIGILVFYALHVQKGKLWRWRLGFMLLTVFLSIFSAIFRYEIGCLYAIATVYALVLLAMYPDDQSVSSFWQVKPFMYCGKISYSLYLIHLPVCWVLAPKFFSCGFTSITQTMIITIPVCMGVSIALAVLFYHYFERPFMAKSA
jgi:peptidoglycan/LPS O-acetylase OafA/YrhL